ncbi:hypothetical protein J6590_053003 [Homalodisca vitripennis]|nr:hypothetical protein J6590_053003 [Homalodisca vitripennis]
MPPTEVPAGEDLTGNVTYLQASFRVKGISNSKIMMLDIGMRGSFVILEGIQVWVQITVCNVYCRVVESQVSIKGAFCSEGIVIQPCVIGGRSGRWLLGGQVLWQDQPDDASDYSVDLSTSFIVQKKHNCLLPKCGLNIAFVEKNLQNALVLTFYSLSRTIFDCEEACANIENVQEEKIEREE